MTDMAQLIFEVGFSSPSTGTYLHLDDAQRGVLDSATLAPDNLWVDLSARVVSVSTRRGATRAEGPALRYEAGTATIVLRNDDRALDPTNLSGPYVASGVTQVEPMRAVRIRGTWNGVTYPLWRGFADDWQVSYSGPNSSVVTLTCSDAFGVFAAYDRLAVAAVGAGENSGSRIHRILDSVGWSTRDRVVAGGDVALQATTLADNVLAELLLTADSELGEFFIDPNGRPRFRSRTSIQDENGSATAQGQFGDLPVDGVATTINYATNPSLETDTAGGWKAIGGVPPTIARSSARAMFGSWSLLATWGTGGLLPGVAYDVVGLTAGRTYTVSVYVWVPAGSPDINVIVAGDGFGTATGGLTDQWVRLVWTGTASASTLGFGIWPASSPTAGQQVWIDGVQVEEGTSPSAYVDGDQAGGEWDGIPHASTSRRLPELPYADAVLTSDAQSMANLISIARTGGTAQVVENAASRTAYLTRTYQRTDLLLQTDAASLIYAEQLLSRASMPELRFSQLVLRPRGDERLWPQALSREIGQRIRVVRRPPGGGAPIRRDVFVRGIEHEITAELQWTTTFVLQHAPRLSYVADLFTRTSVDEWGAAPTGQVWVGSGGVPTDFSVSGGTGRHILSTVNVQRNSLVDLGSPNPSIVVDVQPPGVPTGAPLTHWVVGRAADISNYYAARLDVAVTNVTTITLYKRVAGVLSAVSSAVTVGNHAAGNVWRVRLEALGSLVRAKAWKPAAGSEPGWQVTGTDSSLTLGTQVGVLSRREAGNTSGTVTIFYDNFTATSVYAWA